MSAAHSRSKNMPEKFGQLKLHSASRASCITDNKHGKENRVKLSPNERASGALGVQDILLRCQESDCRQVFEIDLNGQGLEHMPNLTEFTKLKIIDLGCNKIKCVSPHDLKKNTDLRELKLYANEITEITGLDCCKELSNLVLQHNKIKCIGKGLQQLRKLRVLRIDSNCLSAIEPREIASCSQLTALDISGNSITDISALNALPALQELDVSNNKIQRLTDLGRCKKVQELDISRNHLSDLSGLKGLICLTVLRAEYNRLTTLDSLGKLRQLQELHLSNNRLSHVKSFVGQFPSLEILDISNNAIASVDEMFSLSEISTLLELTTDGNPFHSEDSFGCHRLICQKMSQLEVLNKVSVKRPNTGHIRGPPIMRPISASQVLSARQVEEQIKAAAFEQTSLETSIASRFSIVKDLFKSLPVELSTPPDGATMQPAIASSRLASAGEERPASRCNSRSRIAEARAFAAEHFHPEHN